MRDLAVQASNTATVQPGDRQKLQTEFQQLGAELSRIIKNTQFNNKSILNGSLSGGAKFQVGANTTASDRITVNITNLLSASGLVSAAYSTNATGSTLTGGISIGSTATSGGISAAITAIDTAIKKIDTFRATLGAIQNRLTTTVANLQSSVDNQSAARSRITDTDFAAETSNMSRAQILQQAGTAMLSQANSSNNLVLSLLK